MFNSDYTTPAERRIVTKLLEAAIWKGWSVSVKDGLVEGEWTVTKSREIDTITSALASTQGDTLRFHWNDAAIGVVQLVWGNDEDVINDHSDTNEIHAIVDQAQKRART